TEVDAEPIGNDPYSARSWSYSNSGQIAGNGTQDNDMQNPAAWDLVTIDPNIVVAVVDTGVDLTHPDLNIVSHFNYTGAVGGGPVFTSDNHGTACAGDVAAIRNNG